VTSLVNDIIGVTGGVDPVVRNTWWRALRETRIELMNGSDNKDKLPSGAEVAAYMIEQYGMKIGFSDGHNIDAHYAIVDEHKHLLWTLKFSK
jgi:hypothetical protein